MTEPIPSKDCDCHIVETLMFDEPTEVFVYCEKHSQERQREVDMRKAAVLEPINKHRIDGLEERLNKIEQRLSAIESEVSHKMSTKTIISIILGTTMLGCSTMHQTDIENNKQCPTGKSVAVSTYPSTISICVREDGTLYIPMKGSK